MVKFTKVICRSNENRDVGFSSHPNRVNVALTRARRCLLIVGDTLTLSCHSIWAKLIDYINANGKVIGSECLGFVSTSIPSYTIQFEKSVNILLNLNDKVNKKIGGIIGRREGSKGT